MKSNNAILLYLLIALCLFGYILPWVITTASPLTLGAYDLAEWTTLHPSQPATSPPLIVAFLIRLQLVVITLLIGLAANSQNTKFFSLVIIILLSIAQLPPLDFITSASGNPNYQQQFMFAVISLVVGTLLTFFKPARYVYIITLLLLGIGAVAALSGFNQAQNLYAVTGLELQIGWGFAVFMLGYALLAIRSLRNIVSGAGILRR